MTASDPLFEFSLKHWPPIYRYKRPEDKQKTVVATKSVVTQAEQVTPALPRITNLLEPPISVDEDQEEGTSRPASSASSVNIPPIPPMSQYSFPPSSPAFSPSPFGPIIQPPPAPFFNAVPPASHGPATPPPLVGNTYQQFGMMPAYSSPFALPGSFPSMQPTPWGFSSPAAHSIAPVVSGPLNVIPGDFPPLHSLPPSFWEPVVQQPQPDPTPPMHTPQAPSLENLAGRTDGKGENFSDDSLKAIIIKAQPHHSTETLSHLRRDQLVKHVNDLVIWWKQANPQQAIRAQQANIAPPQQQEQEQQATIQARSAQRFQQSIIPPLSPAVAAAAASAAASAKAAEKVIGQCPCCCEAQQNAAFSPCGHLYACTKCAHRVYDGGRGKCPVCRVQIQTYLRIYATS